MLLALSLAPAICRDCPERASYLGGLISRAAFIDLVLASTRCFLGVNIEKIEVVSRTSSGRPRPRPGPSATPVSRSEDTSFWLDDVTDVEVAVVEVSPVV
jgi:hypothetical protein